MSKTLVETTTYDVDVDVPEGGDARSNAAEAVEALAQALANRTNYLKSRVDLFEALIGTVTVTKLVPITPAAARHTGGSPSAPHWFIDSEAAGSAMVVAVSSVDSGILSIDITDAFPLGATLTQVRAVVLPGAARATSGNRMQVTPKTHLLQSTPAFVGGAATAVADSGAASLQFVTCAIGSDARFVHTLDRTYRVDVAAGNDGGTNFDKVYALEITYSITGPSRG
jgi:hypothetical protein